MARSPHPSNYSATSAYQPEAYLIYLIYALAICVYYCTIFSGTRCVKITDAGDNRADLPSQGRLAHCTRCAVPPLIARLTTSLSRISCVVQGTGRRCRKCLQAETIAAAATLLLGLLLPVWLILWNVFQGRQDFGRVHDVETK